MNKDIVDAVRCKLGGALDNLYRAKAAFRNMGPGELAEQHGHSGQTRRAILAEYEADVQRWEAALADCQNGK